MPSPIKYYLIGTDLSDHFLGFLDMQRSLFNSHKKSPRTDLESEMRGLVPQPPSPDPQLKKQSKTERPTPKRVTKKTPTPDTAAHIEAQPVYYTPVRGAGGGLRRVNTSFPQRVEKKGKMRQNKATAPTPFSYRACRGDDGAF